MDELLGRQSAIAEARALYRMIGDEHTVEELRELVAVPQKIEAVLLAYAREFPGEAYFVNRTLKFRANVLKEFGRLVAEGVPIAEALEVEDAELGAAWTADFLYCKVEEEWQLATKTATLIEDYDPENQPQTLIELTDAQYTPLAKESRKIRVGALPLIPDLLDKVKAKAESLIESIDAADKAAEKL